MDEQVEKLAGRLGAVPEEHLRSELERRKYVVSSGGSLAEHTGAVADPRPVQLSHFPDNILIAAAKQRGLSVTASSRSGLDSPKKDPPREPSLLQALDDTYTRDQMETAYQAMLELRKRRRSKTEG